MTPLKKKNFIPLPLMREKLSDVVNNKKNAILCLTQNLPGFTLIELLVVVLIIGILASIALPQYQKAVDKTHAMKYFQVGMGIKHAEEVHYMAEGQYTLDLQALDVDYSAGCTIDSAHPRNNNVWSCPDGYMVDIVQSGDTPVHVKIALCPGYNTTLDDCYPNREFFMYLYFDHINSDRAGKYTCTGLTTRGKTICKSLFK